MRLGGDQQGRGDKLRLLALIVVFGGGFIAFQQLAPSLDIEGLLDDLADDLGELDLRCWSACSPSSRPAPSSASSSPARRR